VGCGLNLKKPHSQKEEEFKLTHEIEKYEEKG
jgi:hypothetical protein